MEIERGWREWVEKEAQKKAGGLRATERKRWRTKGKELLVETAAEIAQTDPTPTEAVVEKADVGIQTVKGAEEDKKVEVEGKSQRRQRCSYEGWVRNIQLSGLDYV